MLTPKTAKIVIENYLTEREILLLCFLYDHHKVLGLPSGEKITDKQISDAYEEKFWPFLFKCFDVDTVDESTAKLKGGSLEPLVPRCLEEEKLKEGESGISDKMLVFSYYILTDPEQRDLYKIWRRVVKWLETMKYINRRKEKLGEYDLLSYDDLMRVGELGPRILNVFATTLAIFLPTKICLLIGCLCSYRAIQSALSRRSGTGECSSGGGEDIQDWELVNEDDFFVDSNQQEKLKTS